MLKRYLASQIRQDLTRKMVFVGGPRQVGKTTLAKTFLIDDQGYLNWDVPEHRERILLMKDDKFQLWAKRTLLVTLVFGCVQQWSL